MFRSLLRKMPGRCLLCGKRSHPRRPGWPNPGGLCATCLLYTVEDQMACERS
jgi:hypothetical protein